MRTEILFLLLAACSNGPTTLGDRPSPQPTTYAEPAPDASAGPVLPLCDPNAVWKTSAMTNISNVSAFGSITPDELTMAWMSKDGVHVADRANKSDAFGAPMLVEGDFALDRAQISADGLRLILTSGDRRSFGVVSRADRTSTFAPSFDRTSFAGINLTVKERGKSGQLGDPVLSADERTFVFSYWGVDASSVRIAHRASKLDMFGAGTRVTQNELVGTNTARVRPSGASVDNRTIFFWDEIAKKEIMAQRAGEDAMTFTSFVDIGARPFASPNATCTTLVHGDSNDGIASSVRD